jgi:cysteine desulfurase
MRIVYADNNATTAVAPEVLDAMLPFFKDQYFNPSSMYDPARTVAAAVAAARAQIARHLGAADPREILFTSCATESNNTAILGVLEAEPSRRHVVTTAVEHPAVLEVCKSLRQRGCEVTFLPVDRHGNLDTRDFIRALQPDTLLVSIMHANNETGVVFPIAELSRIAKETDPKIVFHTDATQSVGKLPIDLAGELRHVDLLSFSGHKLHAPKGVGALFIRRGTPCRPFMLGGHQENGRRAGTENVAFIVGMARALDLAAARHDVDTVQITRLRDRLETGLLERIPYIEINGRGTSRLPGTSNVSCNYIEGEGMLSVLSAEGICASSGSACTSGTLEPSHVLRALNVPFTAVHGSVRFSLSRYNTDEDIERILDRFPWVVERLRQMSPYWDAANNAPRADVETLIKSQRHK